MAKDDIEDKGLSHLTLPGNNPSLWEARAGIQAGQAPESKPEAEAMEGCCWLACGCGLLPTAFLHNSGPPTSGLRHPEQARPSHVSH